MLTIPCPFLSRPGNFLAIFKGVFQPLQVELFRGRLGRIWKTFLLFWVSKNALPSPKFNSSPPKKDGWKMYVLLGPCLTFQDLNNLLLNFGRVPGHNYLHHPKLTSSNILHEKNINFTHLKEIYLTFNNFWTQEPWPATGMIILVGFGHQGHDEILKKSLAEVVVRPQGWKVIKIPFYGTLSGSPGVKLKQIWSPAHPTNLAQVFSRATLAFVCILCQIVTIRCDSKWTGACCQTWLSINWGPFGNDHRTLFILMLSCNPGALACGSCSLGKMKWIEMACETMEQGLLQIKNRQLHGPLAHGGRLLSF